MINSELSFRIINCIIITYEIFEEPFVSYVCTFYILLIKFILFYFVIYCAIVKNVQIYEKASFPNSTLWKRYYTFVYLLFIKYFKNIFKFE